VSLRPLFFCPHLGAGGVQRKWSILLPLLAERGLEPHLLTLEREGGYFQTVRARGIDAQCVFMRSRGDLMAVRRALAVVRSIAPNVIVTQGVRAQVVGQWLAWRSRIPLVAVDDRGPGFAFKPHRELLLRLVAPHADRIAALSEKQLPQILGRRFRRSAVRFIPNGMSAALLPQTRERSGTRELLGAGPDTFLALLVAALRPEKRPDFFVRAVAKAHRLSPSIRGAVAGDGTEYAKTARQAALTDGVVRLLGAREDIGDLMRAADVVCLSSSAEAHPMTVLEAMALARPVIATHVGAIDDIVVPETTGLLVDASDEDAFADALARLARDPGLGEALGRAGAARQQSLFTLDRMADGYARLLEEVCAAWIK
jgi:glycosyltransferase involved in cell wall biosynthesis